MIGPVHGYTATCDTPGCEGPWEPESIPLWGSPEQAAKELAALGWTTGPDGNTYCPDHKETL